MQPAVLLSAICFFRSGIETVVSPLVLFNVKSGGRWPRMMRVERGETASVDVGTVATSCVGKSRKAM